MWKQANLDRATSEMRQYLENGRRYIQLLLIANRKLYNMRFRLASRSMTLGALELL